ncbi:MAG: FCD domain-containing protein [Thermoleophilia bacterium]|nr:FCD domain-containing protein [Thermoleophilia bacterium]
MSARLLQEHEQRCGLERPRLADLLAGRIAETVRKEGLQDGGRLGFEHELLERYDTSRAVLREALRMLERDGVVATKPGPRGGVFGSTPDSAGVVRLLELYSDFHGVPSVQREQALVELEVVAAQLAAARRTNADLADLNRIHRASLRSGRTGHDAGSTRAYLDFHGIILRAAHNSIVHLLRNALLDLSPTPLWVRPKDEGAKAVPSAHQEILEAIAESDPSRTGSCMRRHLEGRLLPGPRPAREDRG